MKSPDIKVRKYRAGAAVVVQGSPNPGFLYVVRSGELEVDSEHRLKDKNLSLYKPGDSFGLVSALTAKKYLVTIYARTDVELIEIPVSSLGLFLKTRPEFTLRLFRIYSRELKILNNHLSRTNDPGNQNASPAQLFFNADIYLEWNRPELASYALEQCAIWCKENDRGNLAASSQEKRGSLSVQYSGIQWDAHKKTIPAGEVLFLENEYSQDIYVIQTGSVRLFKIIKGKEFIIDVLGEGEIFGEMSFLDQSCRIASAVTETESEILRLNKTNLSTRVGSAVLQRVAEGLARRIWFNHQRLSVLRITDPLARIYAFLYSLIRDRQIKNREGESDFKYDTTYTFPITLEELQTMCGILKINHEKLRPFLQDPNIKIDHDKIIIRSARSIKDKVTYIKTQSGAISSEFL